MSIVEPCFPYGYQELQRDLEQLVQRYPFLHQEVIGQSVQGKNLYALRIGSGHIRIHCNGAIHGNEWITTAALMMIVEDICIANETRNTLCGKQVSELLKIVSLWMVPMLNPDGVELVQRGVGPEDPSYKQLLEWNKGSVDFSGWKANIRGVDLNDQFPAGWELEKNRSIACGPGPREYSGPTPLSEPESIAIANYTLASSFRMVLSFHTQGQEIYYTYHGLQPIESEELALRFAQVSGYKPVPHIESDAGYKDWFIQEFRLPGFTLELGLGQNPLPINQFPPIYEDATGIILEALSYASQINVPFSAHG